MLLPILPFHDRCTLIHGWWRFPEADSTNPSNHDGKTHGHETTGALSTVHVLFSALNTADSYKLHQIAIQVVVVINLSEYR